MIFDYFRVDAFDSALNEAIIDISSLRNLCFGGIPEGKGRRSLSWRLLLNFLPPEKSQWNDFLHQQRQLYAQLTGQFLISKLDFQGFLVLFHLREFF